MKNRSLLFPLVLMLVMLSCTFVETPDSPSVDSSEQPQVKPASTLTGHTAADTFTPVPATITLTPTSTHSLAPSPTERPPQTPIPTVGSLRARVAVEKLSCRYGPGALYLYLYALNQTANITLIGRTDANDWVWVDGTNKCWVHSQFLDIQGDPKSLPIVYPGLKLPVSPYYPGPGWAKAIRNGSSVEITWEPVPISPGKYENEFMQQYLVEVWRCKGGQIIFETLGTNYPAIKVENDEPGCDLPSHARVFVQEKHGYGGPIEVPWPRYE